MVFYDLDTEFLDTELKEMLDRCSSKKILRRYLNCLMSLI